VGAAVDRNIYRNYYNAFPRFPCPRCGKPVKLLEESKHRLETTYSKNEHDEDGWDTEWMTERFVCLLVCANKFCGEVITVAGNVTTSHDMGYEELIGEYDHYTSYFVPKSITPAPHIISVSKKLSADCRNHLIKSFDLFWMDAGACANRLRIFVEHLLDQFQIPRSGLNCKGKEHELKLFRRIDLLDEAKPGHKDTFDALRNVGNYGSHQGKAKQETLLDCYELLEQVLADLVDGKRARLEGIAKKLAAQKDDL
jgi:hypothetical protein